MPAASGFAAALERAALRREATPEPVVAAAQQLGAPKAATAFITSERPRPLFANEEAPLRRGSLLRAQGQTHDLAKLTSSAILFVTEPNAAADVWHGAVHASGGAGTASAAYADGQTRYVELTALRALEGSVLVSVGRPAPSIYIVDPEDDGSKDDPEMIAVPCEHELQDLFCLAVGYIGDRGTLWPRSGCVLAGMNNLEKGATLGLLLDAHDGGAPSITMYREYSQRAPSSA